MVHDVTSHGLTCGKEALANSLLLLFLTPTNCGNALGTNYFLAPFSALTRSTWYVPYCQGDSRLFGFLALGSRQEHTFFTTRHTLPTDYQTAIISVLG
jgi:hypothetical protein